VTLVTVPEIRDGYPITMLHLRDAARLIVALTSTALGACRTAHREMCFPERGAEIWVETRYPAATPPTTAPAALTSLRLAPTTSEPRLPGGVIGGRQPRVWIVGPAGAARPDTVVAGAMNTDGRVGLPSAARALKPGVYRVRVRDIGWVDAVRDVTFVPGERLELEVQSRQAAACLEPVVQTAAAGRRDPPPNATNRVWRKGQIVRTTVDRAARLRGQRSSSCCAVADRVSITGAVRDGGHTPLRARA
jgi:hypothetical protein